MTAMQACRSSENSRSHIRLPCCQERHAPSLTYLSGRFNCSMSFEQRKRQMDRRLIWLAVGAFATSTVAFVFAGLLPLISASAKISIAEAGHLMTVFSLSYAIGTPILSTLFGAVDRRRVI